MRDQYVVSESVSQKYTRHRRAGNACRLLFVVLALSLPYGGQPIAAGAGPIVEVTLTEFAIAMPVAVPIGPATFKVTNAGTMEHNFEIEGHGLEKKFDTPLQPGATKTLQTDLGRVCKLTPVTA
jgi:hypothetical protein